VRICYHVSIGSSREFMWRKASAALHAAEKDIKLLSSGRIVNMPRLRETTAQQELEAIVRGDKSVVPPEMVQAAEGPVEERDFDRHPYIRRMEYRGGGFAILMAFELRRRQPSMRQYMFKSELIREAQPFCDISMLSTDGWARSSVVGWASQRSLLNHRLIVAGRSAAQGSGAAREEYSLTEEGRLFLHAMLQKWPDEAVPDPALEPAPAPAPAPVPAPAPPTHEIGSENQQERARADEHIGGRADLVEEETARSTASIPHSRLEMEAEDIQARRGADEHIADEGYLQHVCLSPPRKRWARGVLMTSGAEASSMILEAPTPQRSGHGVISASGLLEPRCSFVAQKRRAAEAFETDLEVVISSQEDIADTDIEMSSQEEAQQCVSSQHHTQVVNSQTVLRLLVDDRERLRDVEPRGLLERISSAVCGPGVDVSRQRLRLGDFAWISGVESCSNQDGLLLDCMVERKRISDLVGRSAVGAHVNQLRRLEFCGLKHCFILLEGDLNLASDCRVYDEPLQIDSHTGNETHVIRSKEDIDDLCARLLVRCSNVGVMMTKDATGTARNLAHLTNWLAGTLPITSMPGTSAPAGFTLSSFERQAAEYSLYERAQSELRSVLLRGGVCVLAAEAICDRHHGVAHAREALVSCSSPEHRLHYFDCLSSCAGLGEQICGSLGVSVPAACQQAELSDRRVYIGVTPEMKRRIFASDAPPHINVSCDPNLASGSEMKCFAEILVRAELSGHSATAFSSKKFLVAVIPGAWIVAAVLEAVACLGNVALPIDIAKQALTVIATKVPERFKAGTRTICLAIIEGLRAAVLAEARQTQDAEQHALLSRLLGLVELTVLTLDLSMGWLACACA